MIFVSLSFRLNLSLRLLYLHVVYWLNYTKFVYRNLSIVVDVNTHVVVIFITTYLFIILAHTIMFGSELPDS